MNGLRHFLAPLFVWQMIPAWICAACWLAAFIGFMYNLAGFGRWRWALYVFAWQFVTIFTAAIFDPGRRRT